MIYILGIVMAILLGGNAGVVLIGILMVVWMLARLTD